NKLVFILIFFLIIIATLKKAIMSTSSISCNFQNSFNCLCDCVNFLSDLISKICDCVFRCLFGEKVEETAFTYKGDLTAKVLTNPAQAFVLGFCDADDFRTLKKTCRSFRDNC